MIRLQRSMIAGLDEPDLATVQAKLQSAIQLEHATIPLYLYALYSLDPGRNEEICGIIQEVVIEEMLHMILACNVLNAIGGTPMIDRPGFIPTYPGPLPGGVESDLRVQLAPFSKTVPEGGIGPERMSQLDCFIQIEEPENPLEFRAMAALEEPVTIGQFYGKISEALGALDPAVFSATPRHQIGPDLMPEAVVVTDLGSARQAIETIVEQGEGTTVSPLAVVGGGYAHYYRFQEIRHGRRLVPVPDAVEPENRYSYTGAEVPFHSDGVYTVPTSPSAATYPAGSAASVANDTFNYTYTSLLKALHAMVNGAATPDQFNRALGLMMSLKSQARAMMSGLPDPNRLVGPTFEYQPILPGTRG